MCEWLPALLSISPWGIKTYQFLYDVFCKEIRDAGLKIDGQFVVIPKETDADGVEELFWHLTTRKPQTVPRRLKPYLKIEEGERLPDLRRCERLSWINPVTAKAFTVPEILAWDYEEGDGRIKTYLWLKKHDFVVIFKKLKSGRRLLITSFYVDRKYTRNNFQKKYDNRCGLQ